MRGLNRLQSVVAAACVFVAGQFPSVACLRAQSSTTGAVRGVVVDPSDAVLPGSTVLLREPGTGRTMLLRTGRDGSFAALGLLPGVWSAEVRAPGFNPFRVRSLPVALGAVTDLHRLRLPVGAAVAVEVTATPEDSAVGAATSLLGASEIDELPLDGRRWQGFARLTPQTSPVATALDLLSFRALSPTQNSTSVDGVSNDQSYSAAPRGAGQDSGREAEDEAENANATARPPTTGYNNGVGAGRHPGMEYTVPEDAVREFRVTAANDSALFGHAAGGTISTLTRSGTDRLHGRLSFLARSSLFAAHDPFAVATHFRDGVVSSAVVKPHDLREQFGGSLGGPIVPGRLFFFEALDLQRRGFPAVSSPQDPAFYSLTATQTALLGNRGVSAVQTMAALNYLDSLTGTAPRRHDQNVNFSKLDWLPTAHDRVSLAYNRAHSYAPGGGRTAPVVYRSLSSLGNVTVRIDAGTLAWSHTMGPRLVNEVRAQVARDLHTEVAQAPLPQEPAISVGNRPPEVAIGPQGMIFGTPPTATGGPNPDERRVELAETLSWSPRRHLLQVGGAGSLVREHIHSTSNLEGTFRYDSGSTGGYAGGLVDWITDYTFNVNGSPNGGCPSIHAATHLFCFRSFAQSFGGADTRFDTAEGAVFVQEQWRPLRRLTVSAGVRYEYELLPLPQQPNAALDRVFGALGGATSRFPEDRNNVGPRVGVAWSPFQGGGTTISAGYGLYYGRIAGATVRSALEETGLPSAVTRVRIQPATETACPQVQNQGFGYPCAFLAEPPANVASTSSAVLFSKGFRVPESQQGHLELEQAMGAGLSVTASVQASMTRQLANTTDLNVAPATGRRTFVLQGGTDVAGVRDGTTFSLPLYTARVDSAFGPVTEVLSNANSTYYAGVLEVRERVRRGLSFRGSVTYSRAIDFGQDVGATPPTNGQYDPVDVRYDKGLSTLNLPWKGALYAVWNAPSTAPRRWARVLASGWMVAPVLVVSSGRPYSYNVFGGARLAGGHESLNGSGGSVYLPTVGRDTLRLPAQLQLDLRASRTVRVREGLRLRGIAEVFNVPNRRNLTAISERAFLVGSAVNGVYPLIFQNAATVAAEGLTTLPFGQATASGEGQGRERRVQLGVRLDF